MPKGRRKGMYGRGVGKSSYRKPAYDPKYRLPGEGYKMSPARRKALQEWAFKKAQANLASKGIIVRRKPEDRSGYSPSGRDSADHTLPRPRNRRE